MKQFIATIIVILLIGGFVNAGTRLIQSDQIESITESQISDFGSYDVLGQATSTLSSHTTTYNHDNYDTAYSWGDWSGEGFITASTTGLTASGNIWATTFYGDLVGNVTGTASGNLVEADINTLAKINAIIGETIASTTASNASFINDAGYLVTADIDTLAELNALMGETIASTTASNANFVNDAGYLTTVDMSDNTNFSVTATGLEEDGDALALSSGYEIPTTASTSNWDITPSTLFATSSILTTAGTSTIPLGVAVTDEIWANAHCYTTVGTADIRCGNGTTYSSLSNLTTATSTSAWSYDFGKYNKRECEIGNLSASNVGVTCTIEIYKN